MPIVLATQVCLERPKNAKQSNGASTRLILTKTPLATIDEMLTDFPSDFDRFSGVLLRVDLRDVLATVT